jgi:CDP-archaeol synthase
MHEFFSISYLIAPLLVGLTFHGLCIKFGWLRQLATPMDRGKTWRGKPLFGPNKTFRGVLAVGLGTSAGVGFQLFLHNIRGMKSYEMIDYGNPAAIALGFGMGAGAMLAELANSLLKRQSNIAAGEAALGIKGIVFYVLDQVDMLLGVWGVLWPVVSLTVMRFFWSAVFLFITHQILTSIGYQLGMRPTAR